jgi:hypothetical protein
MNHRIATCTRDKWCVSTQSGDGIGGAILSVFRVYYNSEKIGTREYTKYAYGEGEGRVFKDSESAFVWALEHGYLQRYFNNGTHSGIHGGKYWDYIRQQHIKYRLEDNKPVMLKRHCA